MQDDLEKLYGILKDGNSAGIDIVPFFEGYERERMKKIFNRAINEGFADTPTVTTYSSGKEIFLRFSKEGKQYQSYQVYCDRHKIPETNISNSIFGNHNTANNVGQDIKIEERLENSLVKTPTDNNKHEVKMAISQFIFWLFSALVTGIEVLVTNGRKIAV
jgi:hypothetical protein